jgi:hypothetical protein
MIIEPAETASEQIPGNSSRTATTAARPLILFLCAKRHPATPIRKLRLAPSSSAIERINKRPAVVCPNCNDSFVPSMGTAVSIRHPRLPNASLQNRADGHFRKQDFEPGRPPDNCPAAFSIYNPPACASALKRGLHPDGGPDETVFPRHEVGLQRIAAIC